VSEHEKTTVGFEESDPDWFSTAVVGAVGIVLLYGIIVAVEALYAQGSRREIDRKVVQEAPLELQGLRAAQLEQISKYRAVDPKSGLVTIPVERAMEIVIRERRGGPEVPAAR
jgi:hypothetical protein